MSIDPEPIIKKVRRVLKAGGWLGLAWNVAAESIESWHELSSMTHTTTT